MEEIPASQLEMLRFYYAFKIQWGTYLATGISKAHLVYSENLSRPSPKTRTLALPPHLGREGKLMLVVSWQTLPCNPAPPEEQPREQNHVGLCSTRCGRFPSQTDIKDEGEGLEGQKP